MIFYGEVKLYNFPNEMYNVRLHSNAEVFNCSRGIFPTDLQWTNCMKQPLNMETVNLATECAEMIIRILES